MTKEELEKKYDETIACLGEHIDYVYNQKSTIEANEPENKTELLSSLYRALYIICEVQLFVSIVQADTCILQKQVLFAKLGYEKRYAFSKYFSSILLLPLRLSTAEHRIHRQPAAPDEFPALRYFRLSPPGSYPHG